MNEYERVARVIRFLGENHRDRPDLARLAEVAGLSPFHFHRLFAAWAGVTPKQFLQCLTVTHVKEILRAGTNVLDSALDAGLSGPGRLHDLCVTMEAASPGELKTGGEGWTVTAGFAESPFGGCLIAESPRGICHLSFVESGGGPAAWAALQGEWPRARIHRDDRAASQFAAGIFRHPGSIDPEPALRVFVQGSAFQVRVWRALMRIPTGRLVSYGELAKTVGQPDAARAVGSAVARNAVAYLIPCHRVIRETGVVGGYRWGEVRKRAILGWECAASSPILFE